MDLDIKNNQKDFYKLQFGTIISKMGSAIFGFAATIWAARTSSNPAWSIALMGLLTTATGILILPFAANIIGGMRKRRVVIVTDIICALTWLIGYFLFDSNGSFDENIFLISALVIISSSVMWFNFTAADGLIRKLVVKERATKGYAIVVFIDRFTFLAGTALGGIAYVLLGVEGLILFNAVSYGVASIVELSIKFQEWTLEETSFSFNPIQTYTSFFRGMIRFRTNKEAWSLIKLTLLLWSLGGLFSVATQYYMATYNKELLSAGMLGIISAIIALPGLVGPFIVTRVGQQKIITLSRYLILFISIPVVLIRVPVFFAHEFGNIDPWIAISVFVIGAMLMTFYGPITYTSRMATLNYSVGKDEVSRLSGSLQFFSKIFHFTGMAIAPYIIINYGFSWIFLATGTVTILVAILYFQNPVLKKFAEVGSDETQG